jgi:hypothetical protein
MIFYRRRVNVMIQTYNRDNIGMKTIGGNNKDEKQIYTMLDTLHKKKIQ